METRPPRAHNRAVKCYRREVRQGHKPGEAGEGSQELRQKGGEMKVMDEGWAGCRNPPQPEHPHCPGLGQVCASGTARGQNKPETPTRGTGVSSGW